MDIIARTCPGCRMFVVYDLRKEEGGEMEGKVGEGIEYKESNSIKIRRGNESKCEQKVDQKCLKK